MKKSTILPTIVYPVNNGYISTLKPTLTGTGAPNATISGTLNQLPLTTHVSPNGVWSYTVETQLTDKASYTVQLSQTEQDGTVSPQITVRFNTDTTLLTPHTVTFPQANQVINTNTPVISGTGKPGAVIEAKQGQRLYTATVGTDGSWQVKAENLEEGAVTFCIDQKDLGNTSPSIHLSFIVDTVSPGEPTINEPSDSGYVKNARPVVRGRGEADAVVNAVVNDKKYTAKVTPQGDWSFEISETLVDDTHIISARQTDQAGNVSPEKVTLFTVKSQQPPVPVVDNPANGAMIRDSAPWINGRGEPNCTIEAHVGSKKYNTAVDRGGQWHFKVPTDLPEGQNTLTFYQIDAAGNVSGAANMTICLDTKAPAPPIVIYPEKDGYVSRPDFTVKGTGEPDATIECVLGGTTYKTRVSANGSWQVIIGGSDSLKYSMEYSLSVRQIDMANNASPCTKVVFRLDQNRLSAPELTFPADQSAINTTPVFTGTGKAGATINLNIQSDDYTAMVDTNNAWKIDIGKVLCPGDYLVNISQTDQGNTSDVKRSGFKIDMSVPQPPVILAPTGYQTLRGPVVISGSGQSGADVTVILDEKSYQTKVKDGNWMLTLQDPLEAGIHSALVNQVTPAGNKSGYSSVSFSYEPEASSVQNAVLGSPTYQIYYNPAGPAWTAATVATLKTSAPITVNGTKGTVFSAVVKQNGLHNFDYTDLNGCSGTVAAGISWVDSTPPVLSIQPSGNYFSSSKTVSYYSNGGSGISTALLNGLPFESGRQIGEEGIYQVEVRDQAGNMSTCQFVVDKTPPIISGAENQKVYKEDVTLFFSDGLSGIKSAVLNGRNILSCARVTENGDYTLKVTDYGENSTELSFKIQK